MEYSTLYTHSKIITCFKSKILPVQSRSLKTKLKLFVFDKRTCLEQGAMLWCYLVSHLKEQQDVTCPFSLDKFRHKQEQGSSYNTKKPHAIINEHQSSISLQYVFSQWRSGDSFSIIKEQFNILGKIILHFPIELDKNNMNTTARNWLAQPSINAGSMGKQLAFLCPQT